MQGERIALKENLYIFLLCFSFYLKVLPSSNFEKDMRKRFFYQGKRKAFVENSEKLQNTVCIFQE